MWLAGISLFLIALTNGKWKVAPSTIADKLDTITKSLHSKTVTWLLHTDTSWISSWAVDSAATIRSEGGSVPDSVEAFKECLRRPKRFIDGLCLQAVAMMQKVSIVIFKPLPQGHWERIAVFQGPCSAHSMPILPLVLHAEQCCGEDGGQISFSFGVGNSGWYPLCPKFSGY